MQSTTEPIPLKSVNDWLVVLSRDDDDDEGNFPIGLPDDSYQGGFGEISYSSHFWLGLEKIYRLTNSDDINGGAVFRLRIELLFTTG